MKRFPGELEALLSARGKRLLAGKDRGWSEALARDGAVVVTGLFDPKAARAAPALLERTLGRSLTRVETKAPPPAEAGTLSALERLPRMERVAFAPFGAAVATDASTRAEEIGLTALCRSESFRAVASVLSGALLRGANTLEVLALGDRDYLGPRAGHFAGAPGGAVEVFISFATGVKRQLLVHERGGHFEAMLELPDGAALIAVKRPRWRYLTPLEGKKGARRWLVGQSFEPGGGRVKRFPGEFEELLSPYGRRILAGKVSAMKGALGREGIWAIPGLIDARWAKAAPAMLQQAFDDVMVGMSREVPAHDELLRKTARSRCTTQDPLGPAATRGRECGLIDCLGSQSFKRFAELLAGERLWGPHTMQVLCNRKGDYAGPHTDAYPEDRWAQHGYFDFHLTFCTPAVKRQLIVYERKGQLTEVREVATAGGLTAYRLPLWHYTTPLEVKNDSARRWIVMNGFFQHAHSPETDPAPTADQIADEFKQRINEKLNGLKVRPV